MRASTGIEPTRREIAADDRVGAAKIYATEGSEQVIRRVPASAVRILDLGCGTGETARLLTARGKIVDGVTLSPREAEQARPHCRAVYAHDLEFGLPKLSPEPYDTVICSHVLEHICYPRALFRDIHAHLAPSGVLIVALPNLLVWKSRLSLLMGRFEYAESGLMDDGHFRWYSFASGRRLLERHGFVVTEASVDGGLPLGRLRRHLPKAAYGWADRIACRLAPGLFGVQLLYVARGAEFKLDHKLFV